MTKTTLTNSLLETIPRHRKRVHGKTKKDTEKWCDFHKIPWHNTDECCSKQSLVAKIKETKMSLDSNYDLENNKRS